MKTKILMEENGLRKVNSQFFLGLDSPAILAEYLPNAPLEWENASMAFLWFLFICKS